MRIVLFAILLLCITFVQAQETVPKKKFISPAGSSRSTVIQRPLNINPRTEKQLVPPVETINKQTKVIEPQPQMNNYTPSLAGKAGVDDKIEDPWTYMKPRRTPRKWYRNISGFRIFLDQGATLGFGQHNNHRVDWYASFGYQFNPIYYLGIGQGFSISLNNEESSAPLFINSRINFFDENTTPYLDFKVGYSFVEGKGLFVNPNFGMSFGKKRRAWNVGIGYSFQKADYWRKGVKYNHKYHGVTLKLTYEFGVF